MSYTEYMEDSIFEIWGAYSDDIATDVLDFLNNEDTFRSFGDGLRDVIKSKMPNDCHISEKDYLKQLNKEHGSILNRNTISNWFEGNRPKKGEQSREHMYILSFMLGLNVEETCLLFQKVYYDKPFDLRSIKEFIYYYCVKHALSKEHADRLYSRVSVDADMQPEGTLYTSVIKTDIERICEDEQLIEYITTHPHNFQISNTSAKAIKDKLIGEIKPTEIDRINLKNKTITKGSSYLAQEIFDSILYADFEREDSLLDKNKNITAIATMLDIIIGVNMVKAQQEAKESIFKNANLPQEIMNRFPTKHTFSKENPSFEELRKMIILLFSYKFWFLKQHEDIESDIDDYQMQLDSLLFEANLQPLYYGNPFDWLFLYCSTVNHPLDLFREIMGEALLFGDVNESYE